MQVRQPSALALRHQRSCLSGTTAISPDFAGDHLLVYSTDNESIDIHDLTDGAGHGILIATDQIFLTQQTSLACLTASGTADSITGFVQADLIYRFKEVKLQEYIGIVQSQQN